MLRVQLENLSHISTVDSKDTFSSQGPDNQSYENYFNLKFVDSMYDPYRPGSNLIKLLGAYLGAFKFY
jgi:hypothetical protein